MCSNRCFCAHKKSTFIGLTSISFAGCSSPPPSPPPPPDPEPLDRPPAEEGASSGLPPDIDLDAVLPAPRTPPSFSPPPMEPSPPKSTAVAPDDGPPAVSSPPENADKGETGNGSSEPRPSAAAGAEASAETGSGEDEFGDFSSQEVPNDRADQTDDVAKVEEEISSSTAGETSAKLEKSNRDMQEEEDEFGDFGDFQSQPQEPSAYQGEKILATKSDEAAIAESQPSTVPETVEEENDDFGDFADFSSAQATMAAPTTPAPPPAKAATAPTTAPLRTPTSLPAPPALDVLFASSETEEDTEPEPPPAHALLPATEGGGDFSDDLWERLHPSPSSDSSSSSAGGVVLGRRSTSPGSSSSSSFGPGLSFVWEDARAHRMWMKVLRMDPKNIVSTRCPIVLLLCGLVHVEHVDFSGKPLGK